MAENYQSLNQNLKTLISLNSPYKDNIERFYNTEINFSIDQLFLTLSNTDPVELSLIKLYHLVLLISDQQANVNIFFSISNWIKLCKDNFKSQFSQSLFEEMNSNFSEGLREFTNNLTDMRTLLAVFDSIIEMTQCGADLETYTHLINFKLLPWIWQEVLVKLTGENPDASQVILALELIQKSQTLRMNQDHIINLLLDRVFEYIKEKFDFEGNDRKMFRNTEEAREILSIIENISISNSELMNDFNSLKAVYGVMAKVSEVIELYQLQIGLDLSRFNITEKIHEYTKNPNFNVYVHKYQSPDKVMAVKIYEPKEGKTLNMNAILFEIKALELLSTKADASNAFLNYYGCSNYNESIYIGMEYQPITLALKIQMMLESKPKQVFTKLELESNIKGLLHSFALMEDLNIYHRDIKPSNILVSDQGQIKIIDFGASEFKDVTDQTTNNRLNFVVGTPAFMAPEIYEAHLAGKDKAVFARGTSDVFSLGMTILQMIFMRDLSTLNMAENNQRLLIIVNNEVKEEWIKSLLLAMLRLDYKERPRFNNCLKYIQSGYTKTFIQNN